MYNSKEGREIMREIYLYDSKTKQKKLLQPRNEQKVAMYCCGPTVYNHAHIGNARPMIVFDNLRRLLTYCGYDVLFISNYTDVDDKIIQAAQQEQTTEAEITKKYIAAYEEVRAKLNAPLPDRTPRVTQYMDKIIDFIGTLIEKDFAYQIDGDVYFRVTKIKNYGSISNRNIQDLLVGARIEENEKKENPLDFCLWKATDVGIRWSSPWSSGRPGWHTECVAMINDLTEDTFVDIHGGGMDLKFPHHENEEAQAYAYCNHELAAIWMHNGMLNINNEKMSKSIGNVILAKDMIEKIGGQTTRWIMNATHYRSPINFTEEVVLNAKQELLKIYTPLKQASLKLQFHVESNQTADKNLLDKYVGFLADDLNVSDAMTVLFDTVKELNGALRVKEMDLNQVSALYYSINQMLDLIGMIPYERKLSDDEKKLYGDWENAKKEKNFALADQFRQELLKRGIL